ncbi:DDE-type integrase/transposase/recombinase [Ochrobactrum daejeonense]|nr:DDE-type integrase/transposase/recombinase [Brucella daejeonensis]
MTCTVDETYLKVRGNWTYLYRAVERDGRTLDLMPSERRNPAAAYWSFNKATQPTALRRRSSSTRAEPIWLAYRHEHNPEIHRNGQDHRFIKTDYKTNDGLQGVSCGVGHPCRH